LNRAAIGIDGDGAATILKRVLGLRGAEAARQQEHGDSETLLHCCDLLSRESHPPKLIRSDSFTQRDPDHFQSISRVLAALVQIHLGSLVTPNGQPISGEKQACSTRNQSNQAAWIFLKLPSSVAMCSH
jgi:hypothetical protein